MRLIIAAVGRMKSGAEQPESRAASADERKEQEASALLNRLPSNCDVIAFDERGKSPASTDFANDIQTLLDGGTANLVMIIGGPDGLAPSIRQAALKTISFGALTLPHQIVRILVAEQAYRAVTILTGHPYHRD